jgi:Fe-S-cluster containining protein
MIRRPKGLFGWFFKFWNTQINGFYLHSDEIYEYENHKVMVMGCRYLQKNGSCGNYLLRPMVCRKWPIIEHFGYPRMLKGCGFKAIPRKPQPKDNPLNIL